MNSNNNKKKRDRDYNDDDDYMNNDDDDDDNDNNDNNGDVAKRSLYECNLKNEYHQYINNCNGNSKARHIYDSNTTTSSSIKFYDEHDAIDYDNSGDGYKYDNNNDMQEMKNDDNNITSNSTSNDNDTTTTTNDDDDGIESVLGFKSPRYAKKVDYLVDEIIKKCTRLNVRHNSISGAVSPTTMGDIPNSIGPHPMSSNLSIILPSDESILSPSSLKMIYKTINDSKMNTKPINTNTTTSTSGSSEDKRTFPTHSGNITHSDWFIEEKSDENFDACSNMEEDDDDDDDEY